MKKILSLFLITFIFAGNLEVEGSISVTEGVTASSFVGDGSGLTNLQSLGGDKPERIYRITVPYEESVTYVVPSGKVWAVTLVGRGGNVSINGNSLSMEGTDVTGTFWIFQNDILSAESQGIHMNIFEYSISGSGSEQGMDYIIP